MKKNQILKNYFKNNIVLNIILLIAISIIISFQITQNMPVILNLNVEVVNYYYEVLVNLAIGYIVSLVFYIIVVYYPEEKKKRMINTKTHILFSRLQTYLRNYIFEVLEVFDIEFTSKDNLTESFINKARKLNAYTTLNKSSNNNLFGEEKTSFEILVDNSKKIQQLKKELIPFIMYISTKEIDFYTDIEEIFIFENIYNLKDGFAVEPLFYNDFEYVVQAFKKVQKIVGGLEIEVQYSK